MSEASANTPASAISADVPEPHAASNAAPRMFRIVVGMLLLALSANLLLVHLGHYHLWGDEADTVMFARSAWETGDLTAKQGDNYYLFRDGMFLENLKNRYTPPLQYYLLAPFWGIDGLNTFLLRLPFALCGLLCVVLVVRWLWREGADRLMWVLMALGILGNVEFFLYARTCRYYALATLLSLVIAYLYVHFDGRRKTLVLLVLASLALMATQYLNYIGLYVALAADYFFFGRKRYRLSVRQWLGLLEPQLLVGIALAIMWNPIGKDNLGEFPDRSLLIDKLQLFWWSLRDMNACEYGVGILMLAAPLLHAYVPNVWLLRAPVALVAYVAAVTVFSSQPMALSMQADVRYLAPLIPLCIFLSVISIRALATAVRVPLLAIPLALVAFGSNVLHNPSAPELWRSTPAEFVHELWHPMPTAITATAEWMKEFVGPGVTVFVMPNNRFLQFSYPEKGRCFLVHPNTYSLMVHAPHAIYGYQLNREQESTSQFSKLPPVQFEQKVPVQIVIAFGDACKRSVEDMIREHAKLGISYELIDTIDVYFNDQTRPELFWHAFRPIDVEQFPERVYIFALTHVSSPQPNTP